MKKAFLFVATLAFYACVAISAKGEPQKNSLRPMSSIEKKDVLDKWYATRTSLFFLTLPFIEATNAYNEQDIVKDPRFEMAMQAYKSLENWQNPAAQYEKYRGKIGSISSLPLSINAAWAVDPMFLSKVCGILGDANAQNTLGTQYTHGPGGDIKYIDYKLAIIWFNMAAIQGNELSQNYLGDFYENGKGTDINYEIAFKNYELSAKKGYVIAQYNLGRFYEAGIGIPKDVKEALRWYRLAHTYADAKIRLGVLFEKGLAEPQDSIYRDYLISTRNSGGYDAVKENAGGYKPTISTTLPTTISVQPNTNDKEQNIRIDFSAAKKQCEALGFKPKTEKFGNCVLELSK